MREITINTYNDSFQVPENWLLANADVQTIDEFLDSYTWDEGEWLYILFKMEKEDEQVELLTEKLKQGYSLFKKDDNQEGIVHINSKESGYQFSYFDRFGAVGDFQAQMLEEMAKKIVEYGFWLCSKNDLQIIR